MDSTLAVCAVLIVLTMVLLYAMNEYYDVEYALAPKVRWLLRDIGQWSPVDAYRDECIYWGRAHELNPNPRGMARWVHNGGSAANRLIESRVTDENLVMDWPYPNIASVLYVFRIGAETVDAVFEVLEQSKLGPYLSRVAADPALLAVRGPNRRFILAIMLAIYSSDQDIEKSFLQKEELLRQSEAQETSALNFWLGK